MIGLTIRLRRRRRERPRRLVLVELAQRGVNGGARRRPRWRGGVDAAQPAALDVAEHAQSPGFEPVYAASYGRRPTSQGSPTIAAIAVATKSFKGPFAGARRPNGRSMEAEAQSVLGTAVAETTVAAWESVSADVYELIARCRRLLILLRCHGNPSPAPIA
jgi:hypothetical protein